VEQQYPPAEPERRGYRAKRSGGAHTKPMWNRVKPQRRKVSGIDQGGRANISQVSGGYQSGVRQISEMGRWRERQLDGAIFWAKGITENRRTGGAVS